MISKNTLKKYEIKTIEEYFNLIIESHINGQNKQAKEYYNKLNQQQKNLFWAYIRELNFNIKYEELH